MPTQLKSTCFFLTMILIEAVIVGFASVAAYLIHFELELAGEKWEQIMNVLPWLIPLKIGIFAAFGLYRGLWRYSSLRDSWRLAGGCMYSSLSALGIVQFLYNPAEFSRAVFLLDGVLTFVMTGGNRVLIRSLFTLGRSGKLALFRSCGFRPESEGTRRILIIGAGGSGEKIMREILENPHLDYHVVGFLDDDPAKHGRAVHGVRVIGAVNDLPRVIEECMVEQVLISTPSATGPEMQRIKGFCEDCGMPYRIVPAIGQILDEKVSVRPLRDINYQDLLRRPPIRLDIAGIEDFLKGRKVLVTGAGGSIGSELCRQLIRFRPKKLILVDAGEANLYAIQMKLDHELHFDSSSAILSRVQDNGMMEAVFDAHHPDVIFHAAACKQVPMLEWQPWEAVFSNVVGSRVIMRMAQKYRSADFVLVSTDKAVRPASVMGTTKRIAELSMLSLQGNGTRFTAVRFGNVLASSGSVVPLFRRQIECGGPVTVCHPEVSRYFMTIPEAAQLILQAGAQGKDGEISVLEMGDPIRIIDLAADLIRLSGKEPGKDIKIIFTGLRPGEKLHEELIKGDEDFTSSRHEKIMVVRSNGKWNWNGFKTQDRFREWLDNAVEELCCAARAHDPLAIKKVLQLIVPEYVQSKAVNTGSTLNPLN